MNCRSKCERLKYEASKDNRKAYPWTYNMWGCLKQDAKSSHHKGKNSWSEPY